MSGLLSRDRRSSAGKTSVTVVFLTALSIAMVCLLLAYSKKRSVPAVETSLTVLPEVFTNRMMDAKYIGSLTNNMHQQALLAGARSEVTVKMQALVDQARAKLPPGADDAVVKAEVAKDPAWSGLEAKNQQKIEEVQKTLAEARELVRKRMEAEASDVKAVAEGKARALTVAAHPAK